MIYLEILSFLATVGIYSAAKTLFRRYNKVYFSPLIITPVILIVLLLLTHVPFEAYRAGTDPLTHMLEPATIALAVPLYQYFHVLKKYALEIIFSVVAGSVLAISSSALLAQSLHLSPELIESAIPRSVTTPIAMDISERIGGLPSITAVIVLVTGIIGSVMGQYVIRVFRIENDVAKGVLFGTSSHAAGTAKAFEFNAVTGSISSVSMILAALITLLAVPLFLWMFG